MGSAVQKNEKEARQDLISESQGYVHHIVSKLVRSLNLPAEFYDEYLSCGYLGLVEAAYRYDFDSGVNFRNYAYLRIRGAVIDGIRRSANLTGAAHRTVKALSALTRWEEEEYTLKSNGTVVESTDPLECESRRLKSYLERGGLVSRMSFWSGLEEASDSPVEHEDPELFTRRQRQISRCQELLSCLSAKERFVIEQHYYRDKSFSEIARQYPGFSKSWVSRLHARALDKLKAVACQGHFE